MAIERVPGWMVHLEEEDVLFIRKFVQALGSHKEMGKVYGVSPATVKLRLEKLVQNIQISEQLPDEPYIALIKRLAVNERLDYDAARVLINEYKKLHETKTAEVKAVETVAEPTEAEEVGGDSH